MSLIKIGIIVEIFLFVGVFYGLGNLLVKKVGNHLYQKKQ